jgi:hypothetical protein
LRPATTRADFGRLPVPKADFKRLLRLVAGARPQWVANERIAAALSTVFGDDGF